MMNPLRPARLALLWLLAGIPLENHTAAIQRIDDAHQAHLAGLQPKVGLRSGVHFAGQDGSAAPAQYDLTPRDVTEESQWAAEKGRRYPGARIALVAPTFADGRDTMVEGISGLLSVLHPSELRGGNQSTAWNRSMGELFLANGSRFKIYSSERPMQLRGPQHHFAWGHNPRSWAEGETMTYLNLGLRLPCQVGWDTDYRPMRVFSDTSVSSPA